MRSDRTTRREAILGAIGGVMSAPLLGRAVARGEDRPGSLVVRKPSPLNAEAALRDLDAWITPVDRFFVRSHHTEPPARADAPLSVAGLVKTPFRLTPDELRRMERVTLPALLQCSGNGRTRFDPKAPGVAWDQGAVGNAEWAGVRLRDLLERAGLDPTAKHVHLRGRDEPDAKSPPFLRSLPIDRALADGTLVAYSMNGADLPHLHGGPLRLVVPGWYGNHWMKWLREITASEVEAPGSFQRTDYRLPRTPRPPGAEVDPEETDPVTALNVKSILTAPAAGQAVGIKNATIAGFAWTGAGRIRKVEVSLDGGAWEAAELHGPEADAAWRMWKFAWPATSGKHRVRARATDSTGAVQPDRTSWNKNGYAWNGIEEVEFEVTAG